MVNIDRIRNAANLRGIKLGKICELLGEKSNYLGKVERGLRRMDENQIRLVANFLGVDREYLTGESNYMVRKTFLNGPDGNSDRLPQFDYERYDERRKTKGILPGYVETQLNLPHEYWEDVRDGYETPNDQLITRLSILLDTTYEYLMGLTDDPSIPEDDRTGVKIRVFGEVAAGIPIKQIDNFDPEDSDSWEEIRRSFSKNGVYFALRIKGDSMQPRMFEGDIVIVRKQEDVESGDVAVVAINGDKATCKKIRKTEEGILLVPLNTAKYEPAFFSNAQIQKLPITILGKVVEVRGKV